MKDRQIKTENDYQAAIAEIEVFIRKGFVNLTQKETMELESISKAVAAYEKEYYPVPRPDTLQEMIELKMYESTFSNPATLLPSDRGKRY